MTQRNENDQKIAELFSAARRADEASAPGFRRVLWRTSGKARHPAPRLRPAFVAAFGVVSVAALAAWLGLRQPPQPQPFVHVDTELVAPPPTELNMERESAEITSGEPGNTSSLPVSADNTETRGSAVGPTLYAAKDSTRDATAEQVLSTPAPSLRAEPTEPAPAPVSESYREQAPLPAAKPASPPPPSRRVPPSPGNEQDRAKQEFETALRRLAENKPNSQPGSRDARGQLTEQRDLEASAELLSTLGYVGGVTDDAEAIQGFRSMFTLAHAPETTDDPRFNTEDYSLIRENDFLAVSDNPLSTFSIDVDTASYSNVRRFLNDGRLPPRDAVRIEEMINYFRYDYPLPDGDAPFSATVEVAGCPWNPGHRLARIGLKGREVVRGDYRGSNLVFLIDVSGSMQAANKLALVKASLAMLVDQLDGRDQVAIVVYAGSSGLVLPSTAGDAKSRILDALDDLEAGGSTNGGEGLKLAYRTGRENFIRGGVNRVILATDGDFNVGVTGKSELLRVIEKDARRGIFLTALGVGMGNYKDDTLEMLADRGNGNYAYLDSLEEARRVLVEQIGGTLVTIAKDVKIQVEFNPLQVGEYRLIGYENRMLNKEDFNDDTKDAGEIGAGHTVTALYELVPPEETSSKPAVDPLKYRRPTPTSKVAESGELLTLKLRYKEPEGDTSRLLAFPVIDEGLTLENASEDFKLAAAVAMFGMVLRESEHRGSASLFDARHLSLGAMKTDEGGLRSEFYELVDRAMELGAD